MTFILRMDLNNHAFQRRGRRTETARILAELADKIRTGPAPVPTTFGLMDVNGNTVGAARIFDEDNEPAPKVVVIVEGGIVQDVFTDSEAVPQYTVVDHDSEDRGGPNIGTYATQPLSKLESEIKAKL